MEWLPEILGNRMLVTSAGVFAAVMMLLISAFHIYWALGGSKGLRATIPEIDGRPLYAATPLGTFTIAFVLLIGALVMVGRLGFFGKPQLEFIYLWGPWLLAAIFMLRAVGDFNYIGLFKKVRYSYFSYWDTRLHSPLSLLLAIACTIVAASPVRWPL